MLEALRRNSKNAIIYILFGVIIAVFIINFGPGSRGCEGAGGGHSYAAKIAGQTIPETEFRLAYLALTNGGQVPAQMARDRHLKEFVMDKLIERELLAQEAEKLGFDVAEDQVNRDIVDGKIHLLGMPRQWDEFMKDGVYDYQRFHNVLQNRLGVTDVQFVEVEKRELLAQQMRQLLLGAIRAAPSDVKQDWEQRETQVNLEFVKFSPRRDADSVTASPSEIADWQKGHDAEIKKQYEERSYLYKKLDKHAHLRHVLVTVGKEATDADVAKAKAKAEEAAKRARAGEDFASVARTISDDRTKARGGDIGWHKKGFTTLGPILDEKIFAAKAGGIIGPDRTERGFEVVKVEGFREGDLTVEQVAPEIAEEQLRLDKAKRMAKEQAEATATKVRGGAKLAELFPKKSDADESDPFKRFSGPPEADETGLFARRGELVPQVGVSFELVQKAFASKVGDVIGPIEASGASVVARVKERKDADPTEFGKKREELERAADREKWAEVLDAWAKQRCLEAKDAGKIRVNDEVLSYEGLAARAVETKYEPCKPLKLF